MNTTRPFIPTILVTALLGGCATTPEQCDPRNENFFNNTSCLASGSYATRQQNMERDLQRERQRNITFQALLNDLEAQRAQLSQTRRSREHQYEQFNAMWRDVQRNLSTEIAENERLKRRIAQINDDLAQSQSPSAPPRQKVELIDDLKHEVLLLQQELDAGVYQ